MNLKDQPGIRILQVNVGRAKRAHDLIHAKACMLETDLLIVPEQKITSDGGWVQDTNKNVAVLFRNNDLGVRGIVRGGNHILLKMRDFSLLACYISPNIRIREYKNIVDKIINTAIRKKQIMIAGDINAKSLQWGSPANDEKGEIWNEWIAQAGLQVLNNNKPTFIRGASQTHIDVTFESEGLSRRIQNWDVLDDQLFTYYRYITYEIKVKGRNIRRLIVYTGKTFNKHVYLSEVRKINEEEISDLGQLRRALENAVELATVKKRNKERTPYWWTDEIEGLREECLRARRNFTRSQGAYELKEVYKTVKKKLNKIIKNRKKRNVAEPNKCFRRRYMGRRIYDNNEVTKDDCSIQFRRGSAARNGGAPLSYQGGTNLLEGLPCGGGGIYRRRNKGRWPRN
ncbi:uncharacterized protein [Diabrotica undecimpunctata]|uniref:uncharacterized protein n=1 Tax=Diabrotica undecimpunctata TaxID=50387 RepID=UPI003B636721